MKRLIVLLLAVLGLVMLGLTRPLANLAWNLVSIIGRLAFRFGRWSKF